MFFSLAVLNHKAFQFSWRLYMIHPFTSFIGVHQVEKSWSQFPVDRPDHFKHSVVNIQEVAPFGFIKVFGEEQRCDLSF